MKDHQNLKYSAQNISPYFARPVNSVDLRFGKVRRLQISGELSPGCAAEWIFFWVAKLGSLGPLLLYGPS